jgi:hypothetical protein
MPKWFWRSYERKICPKFPWISLRFRLLFVLNYHSLISNFLTWNYDLFGQSIYRKILYIRCLFGRFFDKIGRLVTLRVASYCSVQSGSAVSLFLQQFPTLACLGLAVSDRFPTFRFLYWKKQQGPERDINFKKLQLVLAFLRIFSTGLTVPPTRQSTCISPLAAFS